MAHESGPRDVDVTDGSTGSTPPAGGADGQQQVCTARGGERNVGGERRGGRPDAVDAADRVDAVDRQHDLRMIARRGGPAEPAGQVAGPIRQCHGLRIEGGPQRRGLDLHCHHDHDPIGRDHGQHVGIGAGSHGRSVGAALRGQHPQRM